ncbi:hypothetical protein KL86DPRO_20198 [uncultured delta proteobacterium]|uniref:N-acetyltransferase domain-containing protein n=1 Tax=uncultured delta proteobacterium TaxID=34034 RepID=A0A212JWE2_9DELT|nr:hypothetical protein KL86DPRO_20198 [uncultured delta proteobacterium]
MKTRENYAHSATFEEFITAFDAVKRSSNPLVSNVFFYTSHLKSVILGKKCLLYSYDDCLFLLIPRHGIYNDCLYAACSVASLERRLKQLMHEPECSGKPLRILLIGKDAAIRPLYGPLSACDFEDLGKLVKLTKPQVLEYMKNPLQEAASQAEFAVKDDAEKILERLKTEFDLYSDNIPELETIAMDAEKRHIAIIRKDNTIISLFYFHIQNMTFIDDYSWCSVKYRGTGIFKDIYTFVMQNLRTRCPAIRNATVFRPLTNKPSLAIAAHSGEQQFDFFMHTWVCWQGLKPNIQPAVISSHD